MSKAYAPVYQIKITLKRSKPPIWRRVLISSDTTLDELHHIIQAAMGWYGGHLHAFNINGREYSTPRPFDHNHLAELGMQNTVGKRLLSFVSGEGFKFTYEYDFGDDWQHEIKIEKILLPDPKQTLPVCIKGKRACPPEDIGGIWGYYEFLEAMKDPDDPEHDEYKEWIGGDFDPEAFDLDAVNVRLKGIR